MSLCQRPKLNQIIDCRLHFRHQEPIEFDDFDEADDDHLEDLLVALGTPVGKVAHQGLFKAKNVLSLYAGGVLGY